MPKQNYKLNMTMPEKPSALVQAATTIGAALGTATKKVEIAVGRYEPPVAEPKQRLPRKEKKQAKQDAEKKAASATKASK